MYSIIPTDIFNNAFELVGCLATAVTAIVGWLLTLRF